jgi:hypothetical protein
LLHCTSQLLAQSGGGQGGEFTSAFGGAAEVHGPTASAAFDANDPNRNSAEKFDRPQRSLQNQCPGHVVSPEG